LPSSFNWLDLDVVLAIHEAQIAEHGGETGVRDPGLLESAIARPQNAVAYSSPTVAELAALYALGIIKNHPFVDGNKRVAAVVLETFLELHGRALICSDEELVATIRDIAAGNMSEAAFKDWVARSAATHL
jgi:death-on-curing protein